MAMTKPFFEGSKFQPQLQVGLKPYLRNFLDISHPIVRSNHAYEKSPVFSSEQSTLLGSRDWTLCGLQVT